MEWRKENNSHSSIRSDDARAVGKGNGRMSSVVFAAVFVAVVVVVAVIVGVVVEAD